MIQYSEAIEENIAFEVAQHMCAAARTAPKTKGIDRIETCIVTGQDKDKLAAEMRRIGERFGYDFFFRDAQNVQDSLAVVLIGVSQGVRGLNEGCGYCNFANCQACNEAGAVCVYDPVDLGIAVGSAVSIAADARVDSRVMFSVGRSAMEMGLFNDKVKNVLGIPLSIAGKSPYFDRQPKK